MLLTTCRCSRPLQLTRHRESTDAHRSPGRNSSTQPRRMLRRGRWSAMSTPAPVDGYCESLVGAEPELVEAVARTRGLDPSARLLTDHEVQRVCNASVSKRKTSQRQMLVALSLASATAVDVASVRAKDVNLDNKTVRFRGPSARVCALDEWSYQAIGTYLRANPTEPDELLCVKAGMSQRRAARAVTNRLCAILRDAGLGGDGASPRSIRLTAARKVLESDDIVAAAKFLGSPSLNRTAAALDHAWQHDPPPSAGGDGDG